MKGITFYYVDRHEDEDVVSDRVTYLANFFHDEIYKHCWIQISKTQYLTLKHINELKTIPIKTENTPDISYKIDNYVEEHLTHFYNDGIEEKEMVMLHIDDYYLHDANDTNLPAIKLYGGNTSVRLPPGCKPRSYFGQDEAIFRSSQLSKYCWTVDGEKTLQTKGLGTGVMVSAMVSCAFGFGLEINENEMSAINSKRIGISYTDCEVATHLYGRSAKKH